MESIGSVFSLLGSTDESEEAKMLNLMALIADEEEDKWWDRITTQLLRMHGYGSNIMPRQPCRIRPYTSHHLVYDTLGGHEIRSYDYLRMSPVNFFRLRDALLERGLIQDLKYIGVNE